MKYHHHPVLAGALAGALAIGAGLGSFSSASACLNGVERHRHRAMSIIGTIEKLLDEGNAKQALTLLTEKFTSGRGFEVESPLLQRRISDLYAVARLRAGGKADIEAATVLLRSRSKEEPKNLWLKVRLAEALSYNPSSSKEALQILTGLFKSDLIVDAAGFTTLARLRKQDGDAAGAQAAMERCKAVAKQPGVCNDAPLPSPPESPASPPARFTSESDILRID